MADNELLSFISGGNTGVTYPELARRRAIAAALASKQRAFPKTMGEGMTYLGESLGEVWKDRQTNEMEARLRAQEAATKKGGPGSTYTPGGGLFDPKATAGAPALASPQAFFADPEAAPQEVAQGNPTQGGPMVPPGSPSPEVMSDAPDIGGPGDQLAMSKTAAPYAPVTLPTSLSPRVPADAAVEDPEPTPTSIQPAPMQVAQTGPAGLPSSMFNLPPPAFGGAPAAPARRVDAFPAEDGAAPNAPPSQLPIPAMKPQEMPDPGKDPPPRPKMLGPSPQQRYWAPYIDNPNVSPELQAHARRIYDTEDKYRTQLMQQQAEEYKDKRERWQAQRDAKDKFDREAYDRNIQQQVTLTGLESTRADLAKKYFDAGIPRQQAVTKADLDIKNAMADLQKKAWEATQQGVTARKNEAETTSAEQTAAAGKAPAHVTVDDKLMIWDQESKSFKPMPPPPKGEGRPDIKLNESQAKTFSNLQTAEIGHEQYKRVPDADRLLAEGLRDELAGKIPFFSNAALSNRYRRARNAALHMADAQMREISGASIGVSEEAKAIARLFPVYGDDPGTTKQKAEIREGIVTGMKLKLGRAGELGDYARTERQKIDAAEQAKIDVEMKDAPKIIGKVYKDGNKRRYWTGSRWEDD